MCGEKSWLFSSTSNWAGSPPRMRGKGVCQPRLEGAGRITPAYAGKSTYQHQRRQAGKDHPRVCGEKYFTIRDKVAKKGSPPRMRGKVAPISVTPQAVGITPACAGKSRRLYRAIGCSKGSPPRMRGKVLHQRPELCSHGITPAYAGKSIPSLSNAYAVQDHPRVCGEKGSSTFWSRNHSGSPPRMRGKVLFKTLGEGTFGITPACVGKRSAPACQEP